MTAIKSGKKTIRSPFTTDPRRRTTPGSEKCHCSARFNQIDIKNVRYLLDQYHRTIKFSPLNG
ncbi:MAG TPA: hypothetical protein VKN76_14330 [Kiloniellaceae bacterium]|nr:hypothetical protein [Kiloniellaceae bacterium]